MKELNNEDKSSKQIGPLERLELLVRSIASMRVTQLHVCGTVYPIKTLDDLAAALQTEAKGVLGAAMEGGVKAKKEMDRYNAVCDDLLDAFESLKEEEDDD